MTRLCAAFTPNHWGGENFPLRAVLLIVLALATLYPDTGESQVSRIAPGPGLTASNTEAQLVGTWTILVRSDGWSCDEKLGADHSVARGGQRVGSWEIKGKQMVVTIDKETSKDTYDLPVRGNALYGRSTSGNPIMLARAGEPASPALEAQIIGQWDYNPLDGDEHHLLTLGADHTIKEYNAPRAHWRILGHLLSFDWEGRDVFQLPGVDGEMMGVKRSHIAVMLSRQISPAAMASKPESADGVIQTVPGVTQPDTSFFGTRGAPSKTP